uniref:Potassium channel domain-containing protein n=1 Tax=Panagrolaimus davidi TaxID=227884 RepID=A0A914QND5_9BILA
MTPLPTFKTFIVRKQTRRFSRFRDHSTSESETGSSPTKAGSVNLDDIDDEQNPNADEEQLRIPVVMVLLVLVTYTAVGGFLFQAWEGWSYFEAFYFCFITMATIGFGDIVPTEKVYTIFTMMYIIFGLSLATMCIDLAGTEYINKIHYLGKKMSVRRDDAKGAVLSGLEVGEILFKHNGVGLLRTAGGKFLHIGLSKKQIEEIMLNPEKHRDILREPLPAAVQRLAEEHNIKIMPDDIAESEGYILSNRDANKPHRKRFGVTNQYMISRTLVPAKIPTSPLLPFVLKESSI